MSAARTALIPAAGRGTRLGDLTLGSHKTMLELRSGVSVLEYTLRALRSLSIRRFVIVVGHREAELRAAFGGTDVEFVSNPEYAGTNVLVSATLGLQQMDDDFVYVHGDTIAERTIYDVVSTSSAEFGLAVDRHLTDEEAMKVIVDGGNIVAISKDIDPGRADGEFIGIARISRSALPDLLSTCERLISSPQGRHAYFEAALAELIAGGRTMSGIDITGKRWAEIDFADDLRRAREIAASAEFTCD